MRVGRSSQARGQSHARRSSAPCLSLLSHWTSATYNNNRQNTCDDVTCWVI